MWNVPTDGTVGFLDRQDREDRAERGMDVDDVVLPVAEDSPHLLPERHADRDARLRAVGVDRLAASDADDSALVPRSRDVRRDDVDVVSALARFLREEVDVLADAAEVRIVVLRNERDAQGAHRRQTDRGERQWQP